MRRAARAVRWTAASTLVGLLLVGPGHAAGNDRDHGQASDPLAAEIARWSAFLRDTTSTDENWKEIKPSVEPAMARTEAALAEGRRLLALERLSATRMNLAGFAYVNALPADRRNDPKTLEAEWARLGPQLGAPAASPPGSALDGVRPAAVRAEAEAALPQARNYYEASLEYGQATTTWFGLFYLGVAQAQREFVDFCRTLAARGELRSPPVRSIGPELDAIEADLLKAYRPPASIDRHPEFIAASAAVKEARELDAAGLRYGALLRYLQAAMRVDLLRPDAPKPNLASLPKRLDALESRLAAGGVDHTIASVYLETARAHLDAGASPGANPAFAEAIVDDVLPRYFAALAPAPPLPPKPVPRVTVTLVRWPYT
jgi:hypothetical protein